MLLIGEREAGEVLQWLKYETEVMKQAGKKLVRGLTLNDRYLNMNTQSLGCTRTWISSIS